MPAIRDEVVRRAARQPVQPAVRRQQRVGDAQRVAAPRAAADAPAPPARCRRAPPRHADASFSRGRSSGNRSFILRSSSAPSHGCRRSVAATDRRRLSECRSRALQPRILSRCRRRVAALVARRVRGVTGAACGDPPDKEMQQAQGAIDAARAAGADQYARDEFTAAEDALKRAHEAVDQRDYRQALNNALDARERAQTAAKEAVNKQGHRARRRRPRRSPTPMPRCTTRARSSRPPKPRTCAARTLADGTQGDRQRGKRRARSAHSVRQGRLSRRDRDRRAASRPICGLRDRTISRPQPLAGAPPAALKKLRSQTRSMRRPSTRDPVRMLSRSHSPSTRTSAQPVR